MAPRSAVGQMVVRQVPGTQDYPSSENPGPCLGTLWGVPGMEWVEAKDTAQHLDEARAPNQRMTQLRPTVPGTWLR